MTWKRQRTSHDVDVEVSLDEFSEEQLLQGLIDSKWITEVDAEAIKMRNKGGSLASASVSKIDDCGEELDKAKRCLRRGDKQEALHYLEQFLGREWYGVLN